MKNLRRRQLIVLTAVAGLTLLTLAPSGAAVAASTGSRSPAQYPSVGGVLYRVAATSAKDVWAVGLTSGPALIWHWNGSSWLEYPFSQDLYFFGVSAQSPTNAWAVGGTYWFEPTQTVAYHWNGKTWRQVPTPTPGGTGYFNAVAATSPSNAWAVGMIGGGPGAGGFDIPLIEHWNGKRWRRQFFNLPKHSGEFNGVAAISARNAWAVGQTNNGGPSGALIEHWNGRRSKRISPGTVNSSGYLTSVAATGPNNVWAVGYNNDGPTYQSLILHWNGNRWSPVPSPNPTGSTDVLDVSARSVRNTWAVGYTSPNGCSCGTAAFHWNGKTWRAVSSPNPPANSLDALEGVVAISRYDAWAVGTIDWGSTLIEHWNGRSWHT